MKTPLEILEKFEQASDGLDYGTVTLCLFVKQGRLRYTITWEESIVPHIYYSNGKPQGEISRSKTIVSDTIPKCIDANSPQIGSDEEPKCSKVVILERDS
jgi:hypothetical protein